MFIVPTTSSAMAAVIKTQCIDVSFKSIYGYRAVSYRALAYTVAEVHPDGTGVTKLILERA